MKPGDTDSLPFFKARSIIPPFFDDSHNLMPGNDGQLDTRQLSFDSVKVSVADSADLVADEDVFRLRFRDGDI